MGRSDAAADIGFEATRPLLLGYVRAHLLMTTAELASVRRVLADFADREGYTIGTVFLERNDTVPAAFDALLADVERQEARALVVPTAHHLCVLGAQSNRLEQALADRVLSADSSRWATKGRRQGTG